MRRKTFDLILTGGGALVVVVLLAAGALALWGYSYSNSSVRNQLAKQEIFFPAKSAFAGVNKCGTPQAVAAICHPKTFAEITPAMVKTVEPYAGQQVLNGQQAAVYANDFIAVHLSQMPYGGVYAKVSAAALAAKPGSATATSLSSLETTVFQGTTLRAMLLEANGFWTFGQIALWASIIAFILAGVMAVLTGLGVWHLQKVSAEEQVFPRLYKEESRAA